MERDASGREVVGRRWWSDTLIEVCEKLFFVGFMKYNPVESVQEIGDLLDIYMDETPEVKEGEEKEERGVLALFIMLANELANEGFLADFVEKMIASEKALTKSPQDHKKPQKKGTKN